MSSKKMKREFWDDAVPADYVPFETTVTISNGGCDVTDFKLDITGGDGEVISSLDQTLDEEVTIAIPSDAFPVTGSGEFADGTTVEFTLTGHEGVLYAVADGEIGKTCDVVQLRPRPDGFPLAVPTVNGEQTYALTYC